MRSKIFFLTVVLAGNMVGVVVHNVYGMQRDIDWQKYWQSHYIGSDLKIHCRDLTKTAVCHELGYECQGHVEQSQSSCVRSAQLYKQARQATQALHQAMECARLKKNYKHWGTSALLHRFFQAYQDGTCSHNLTSLRTRYHALDSLGAVLTVAWSACQRQPPIKVPEEIYRDSVERLVAYAHAGNVQAQALMALHCFTCEQSDTPVACGLTEGSYYWINKLADATDECESLKFLHQYKLEPALALHVNEPKIALLRYLLLYSCHVDHSKQATGDVLQQKVKREYCDELVYTAFKLFKSCDKAPSMLVQKLEETVTSLKALQSPYAYIDEIVHCTMSWLGSYYAQVGDCRKALYFLTESEVYKSQEGMEELASVAMNPSLAPEDSVVLINDMIRRAESGSPLDQRELAALYVQGHVFENGVSVEKNPAKAYELINLYLARYPGDADAWYMVFYLMHNYGGRYGIVYDVNRAYLALTKSIDLGHSLSWEGALFCALVHVKNRELQKAVDVLSKVCRVDENLLCKGLIEFLCSESSHQEEQALICMKTALLKMHDIRLCLEGQQELIDMYKLLVEQVQKKMSNSIGHRFILSNLFLVMGTKIVDLDETVAFANVLEASSAGILGADSLLAYLYRSGTWVACSEQKALDILKESCKKNTDTQGGEFQSLLAECHALTELNNKIGIMARYEVAKLLLRMKDYEHQDLACCLLEQAEVLVVKNFNQDEQLHVYPRECGLLSDLAVVAKDNIRVHVQLAKLYANCLRSKETRLDLLSEVMHVGLPALMSVRTYCSSVSNEYVAQVCMALVERLIVHKISWGTILHLIEQAYTVCPTGTKTSFRFMRFLRNGFKSGSISEAQVKSGLNILMHHAQMGDLSACAELALEYVPDIGLGKKCKLVKPSPQNALEYIKKLIDQSYLDKIDSAEIVVNVDEPPVKLLGLILLAKLQLKHNYAHAKRLIAYMQKLKCLYGQKAPSQCKKTYLDTIIEREYSALMGVVAVREHAWADVIRYYSRLSLIQGPSLEADLEMAIAYVEKSFMTALQEMRIDCYNGAKRALVRVVEQDGGVYGGVFVMPLIAHLFTGVLSRLAVAGQQDSDALDVVQAVTARLSDAGVKL